MIGGALAAPVASFAQQQAAKVYRIGYLGVVMPTPEGRKQGLDLFHEAMRKHGWIEGQHYVIEERWAEGRPERYPEQARELVKLGVDMLMSLQVPGIRAAMQATQTLPIVMIAPSDPVGGGLVASYARPGGNVTGLSFDVDLSNYFKQVDFLKQIVPNFSSIALFSNPDARFPSVASLTVALPKLGLKVVVAGARNAEEIEPAFAKMKQGGAQAVLMAADGMVVLNISRITDLALKHRLPLASQWLGVPRAGGLMAYAPELSDNWRRSASYVDRIMRGAKPADLPVELPSTFKFVINMKTAKALGLVVPQALLLRVDEVIE
jgi:putative ABC transport system substrate-binding protein